MGDFLQKARSLPRIEVSGEQETERNDGHHEHRGHGLIGRLGFRKSDRKDGSGKNQHKHSDVDSNRTALTVDVDEKNFWSSEETLERPVIAEHYRTLDVPIGHEMHTREGSFHSRPSMIELMEEVQLTVLNNTPDRPQAEKDEKQEPLKKFEPTATKLRLGWVEGVLMRCLLDILGVMLFLRITWVSGQAGVLCGTLIVLLSATVTSLTAISMSAICTNGEVKGGGIYFMMSRSLGPEFGGSIGVLFSFAYAVAAAMHLVGLAETIRDIMKEHGYAIFDNGLSDVRIIGLVTCTIWMFTVFAGTAVVSKTQTVLIVILTASLLDYVVGTFRPVTEYESVRGVTGYSFETLSENMGPSFRDGYGFFSIFGIFFPAASGIMAGANISGDLRDPSTSIPKGTLLAIAITTSIYLFIIWGAGATAVRDAAGIDPIWMINDTWSLYHPDCMLNHTCKYGLINNFQVMETQSLWGPLITAGIFAATLSSALSALVSSPKVFQAVCQDRIFPYIHVFGKGYGKDEDPYRAYGLVYAIAMCFILIADLNVIAPIISNFFLAAFALVNYACFDASFSRSIGFRPTFKYYNKWVSLVGALLCLFVMFITAWATALFSFVCFGILFMYIKHSKPDINWGTSVQANNYRTALSSILRLTNTEEHVKNYRPQILVLTGNPAARTPLVDFAYNITKGNSLMICGHVVPYARSEGVFACIRKLDKQFSDWLRKRKVKAFYYPVADANLRAGTDTLLQTAGLGKLRPNILMVGFKTNWYVQGLDGLGEINDYFGVIRDAFENNMGLAVLRNSTGGLDLSEIIERHDLIDIVNLQLPKPRSESHSSRDPSPKGSRAGLNPSIMPVTPPITPTTPVPPSTWRQQHHNKNTLSVDNLAFTLGEMEEENPSLKEIREMQRSERSSVSERTPPSMVDGSAPNTTVSNIISMQSRFIQVMTVKHELMAIINRFKTHIKRGVIDVWWLYDDGGLSLLIPYLLTTHKSYLEGAKLRVFTIASSHSAVEKEQRDMAELLSQFRIHFSDVFVLPDMSTPPKESTVAEFDNLILPFRASTAFREGQITDIELESQRSRTNRNLRCREMLLQNSFESDLVVITMPVPRRKQVSSCLFMAWLDMLTHGLPPTLLIRGNQQSVLTVYS